MESRKKHKVRSKATFFQPKEQKEGNNQVVNVNVTIEQPDDGIAECLTGCFSACLGIGKKAATA